MEVQKSGIPAAAANCEHCGRAISGQEVPIALNGKAACTECRSQSQPQGEGPPPKAGFRPIQVHCQNCGANISFHPSLRVSRCDYCGGACVVDGTPRSDDWPRIDHIYEDQIGRDSLTVILANFFCGSAYAPDDLIDTHRQQGQSLCYCPFFRFDISFSGSWSADVGYYYYTEQREYSEVSKEWTTRRVQHTRWEPASGAVAGGTTFIAVASGALSKNRMAGNLVALGEQLLPGRPANYRPELITGAQWLNPDRNADDCWPAVETRLDAYVRASARAMVPGDTNRGLRVSFQHSHGTEAVLIPFWFYSYSYKGKGYMVVVDAVRGGVVGERPRDYKRVVMDLVLIGMPVGAATVYGNTTGQKCNGGIIALFLLELVVSMAAYHFKIKKAKCKMASLSPEQRAATIEDLRASEWLIMILAVVAVVATLVGGWILAAATQG